MFFFFFKDTGKYRNEGDDCDPHTYYTHTLGAVMRMGFQWYATLEDHVEDAGNKKHQGSHVVDVSHCRFLQPKSEKE